jgi:uncharacterized protein YjbI with pentapeptide repeats
VNGTSLNDALFIDSHLTNARFVNANISGTDFTGAANIPAHLNEMIAKRQ